MAVMRVEKNSNYTVMANHHLRDKRLSLKAKGLLSVMISLPAEWDYTLAGLAYISKEGVSAIRAAIQELEENGYVTRARLRNEAGQLGDTEYTIYEFPQNEEKAAEPSSPPQAPVSASADVSENVEPVCGNPICKPVPDDSACAGIKAQIKKRDKQNKQSALCDLLIVLQPSKCFLELR